MDKVGRSDLLLFDNSDGFEFMLVVFPSLLNKENPVKETLLDATLSW